MDRQAQVTGHLDGSFQGDAFGPVAGRFSATTEAGRITLTDETGREIARAPLVRLLAGGASTFRLFHVTIGNRFHWERTEDQTFLGDLILLPRDDGTITVINEIPLEDYLESVISSEMSARPRWNF